MNDDSHRRDYLMKNTTTGEVMKVTWREIGEWYLDLWKKDRKKAKAMGDPNYSEKTCEKIAQKICAKRIKERKKKARFNTNNNDQKVFENDQKDFEAMAGMNGGCRVAWWIETLEIKGEVTQESVKRGYRNLAKKHHPDVGGDPMKFKKVIDAYEASKEHFKSWSK